MTHRILVLALLGSAAPAMAGDPACFPLAASWTVEDGGAITFGYDAPEAPADAVEVDVDATLADGTAATLHLGCSRSTTDTAQSFNGFQGRYILRHAHSQGPGRIERFDDDGATPTESAPIRVVWVEVD